MFVIEDEFHAEHAAEFQELSAALAELRRLAVIPWDERPNRAPCTSWRKCGRRYLVIEFDDSAIPWTLLRKALVLDVSAAGVVWRQERVRDGDDIQFE